MNSVVERATHEDVVPLEVLARLTFSATFGHLYSAEDLTYHLDKTCSADFFARELSAGCSIWVARMGASLVGYIKYGEVGLPIAHGPDDVEIHRLYIMEGYQQMGLGQQLMQAALSDPRIDKAPHLFVGVWENNEKAQRFYGRYGFVAVGEYTYYVGSHADREIIMGR